MSLSIISMSHGHMSDLGLSTTAGALINNRDYVYIDDTNTEVVYNYNTLNPTHPHAIFHGDYTSDATAYACKWNVRRC